MDERHGRWRNTLALYTVPWRTLFKFVTVTLTLLMITNDLPIIALRPDRGTDSRYVPFVVSILDTLKLQGQTK